MRTSLGVLVLLLGTGGLGWYASKNNAVRIQEQVTKEADAVASGAEGLQINVSGRDIELSGVASTQDAKDKVLEALNAVDGRRVVRDDTSVLPVADPFEFSAKKQADATTYSGVVPSEDDRGRLAQVIGDSAKDLTLSGGSPEGWTDAVLAGLGSMAPLDSGELKVSNTTLSLTGMAKTPAERDQATAALNDLASDFTKDVSIDVMDDGNPLNLMVQASREGGISSASGKLPADYSVADLSKAFGADVPAADINSSELPATEAGWGDAASQGMQGLALLETGKLQIEDNVVTLTGKGKPDAIANAENIMANMPSGFTGKANLSAADDGEPYTAQIIYDGAAATVSGRVPANIDAATISSMLDVDTNTSDVKQAPSKDETGAWPDVLANGTKALKLLEKGELVMQDRAVMLSGLARTPAVEDEAIAAFGTLPEGYDLTTKIDHLDDGKAPAYSLDYTRDQAAKIAGKLPQGMDVPLIAKTLGLSQISGEPVNGLVGDSTRDMARMKALQSWMPKIKAMKITSDEKRFDVAIEANDGEDLAAMRSELTSALGDGASVVVTGVEAKPDTSNMGDCNKQSDEILKNNLIQFATGSATINTDSMAAITSIAEFVLECTKNGAVKVEIGGHTDNVGSPEANLALSQARAESVRAALIKHGVAEAGLIAKGYGDTRPIGDNATAEGRAVNRRTTLEFSQ